MKIKLKDYKADEKNFNAHTSEGMELLQKSVETVGVIEAVTVSNDDVILSGNARQETINKVLPDAEPIVIETDGARPIVIKRTDIESGTKKFHEAALLANTTAKKNINLNYDLIQEVAVEEFGIDIEEVGVEVVETCDFSNANKELNQSDFENQKYFFKLEYSDSEYAILIEKIAQKGKTPEQIFYEALV